MAGAVIYAANLHGLLRLSFLEHSKWCLLPAFDLRATPVTCFQ